MTIAIIDVVNMALDTVGASPITSGELTTPTTPNGVILARDYVTWIKDVMRAVDWTSLASRFKLVGNGTVVVTLSSAAVGSGVTATPASAYFVAKDVGRILHEQPLPTDPSGTVRTGQFTITAVSADVIPVATGTVDSAFNSATLAVQGWNLSPLAAWTRAYALPSDYVKARALLDSAGAAWGFGRWRRHGMADAWEVEGQYILTDLTTPVLFYTYYESDPSKWDDLLLAAVVARMAADLCWTVTKNEKLTVQKWQLYQAKLNAGQSAGKTEQQRRGYSLTTLMDVR